MTGMKDAKGTSPGEPVGAVLVVGGGIAGMQAALDLAGSGIMVHLVEGSPALGGRMAQLDKTFPTNECSMCIISPKLVEVGRHGNIRLVTYSEVQEIAGEMGRFRARILRKARYVSDRCVGCDECAKVCPVEVPSEFDAGTKTRKAIYRLYPQAVPATFCIDKADRAPCVQTCPAGTNVQGYVALIKQGKYREAVKLIRECLPLPATLGRICPAPCEGVCRRGQVDAPVAVRQLKRFVVDMVEESEPPAVPDREMKGPDDKVAVIGSGPAGLSCAYFLAIEGYHVTLFEALPVAGGMLRVGIPDYRLPPAVLDREIDYIRRLGVDMRLGAPVGRERTIASLFGEGYRAVYLATGAHVSVRMGVPGEDARGVVSGVEYLRRVNLGGEPETGRRVAVVGGGDVAVDAARSALRRGADEVTILYRRSRGEMPARPEEVEAAEAEGIEVVLLASPKEVLVRDGRVWGLRCIRMELGEPDASGRRRPMPVEGSDFEVECDTVIAAIGQAVDQSMLAGTDGVELTGKGTIVVDPVTWETTRHGLFAGGDLYTGPSIAIRAVAAGKEAAISMDRFMRGESPGSGRPARPSGSRFAPLPAGVKPERRARAEELLPATRRDGWEEVEQRLPEDEARREASRCVSCGICSECMLCVATCQAKAVDHSAKDEILEIEVGSVILAPGYEPFPGPLRGEFGHGVYPNVMTSLEFERLLSASGPTGGKVVRPGDGRAPRRIAWIQCVGSRDAACGRDYCSSVCCMYATKEAVIAREHDPDIEAAIFYIDLRAFGKGFDDYVARAKDHHGVRYVRAMPSRVIEDPTTGNLELRYMDEEGRRTIEEFDLVVLSVGLQISERTRDLARSMGVDLDPFGFAVTGTFEPLATSRPGVFVSGVLSGPKDIPETVSEASGAAGAASSHLARVRGTLVREEVFPEERPVGRDEAARTGVFVCHCGINIAGVVDVAAVETYSRSLPGVVHADRFLYTCSQDSQLKIREAIQAHRLNRIVVASCTPRTHEPLFQQTLMQAGLNKYLFEMANIRDQCSWVHQSDRARATEKAKRLVRMSVACVARAEALVEHEFEVNPGLLVIGGGLAGMVAAREAARQGFAVHLVEQEPELGGMLRRLRRTADGKDVRRYLERLRSEVLGNPAIRVYTGSAVVEQRGFVGNFETDVMTPGGVSRTVRHGAVLVATGGRENRPHVYGLGEDERVMTQKDFEELIEDDPDLGRRAGRVVMIQCAGSRDGETPYCSRVCCNQAVKNALAYKRAHAGARVDILYRDVRTYGLGELNYRAARRLGVNFVRYDPGSNPPRMEARDGGIEIRLVDPSVRREIALAPDLVVLSTGMLAAETEDLATMLRVPRTPAGFFIEAHSKLRPVDFASEGLFLAGVAHGPKSIPETISQASAAVARAATILTRRKLRMSGVVSSVDPDKCAVCLTCVRACPYHVPAISAEHTAEINPALCQGCGICAAECPAKAITLGRYGDGNMIAKLDALREQ